MHRHRVVGISKKLRREAGFWLKTSPRRAICTSSNRFAHKTQSQQEVESESLDMVIMFTLSIVCFLHEPFFVPVAPPLPLPSPWPPLRIPSAFSRPVEAQVFPPIHLCALQVQKGARNLSVQFLSCPSPFVAPAAGLFSACVCRGISCFPARNDSLASFLPAYQFLLRSLVAERRVGCTTLPASS